MILCNFLKKSLSRSGLRIKKKKKKKKKKWAQNGRKGEWAHFVPEETQSLKSQKNGFCCSFSQQAFLSGFLAQREMQSCGFVLNTAAVCYESQKHWKQPALMNGVKSLHRTECVRDGASIER